MSSALVGTLWTLVTPEAALITAGALILAGAIGAGVLIR